MEDRNIFLLTLVANAPTLPTLQQLNDKDRYRTTGGRLQWDIAASCMHVARALIMFLL